MRIYFDRHVRVRGFSLGLGELWVASWLRVLLLPFVALFYYLPRAIWRTGLAPTAKIAIIGAVFGVIILVGVLVGDHTGAQAKSDGCISDANLPSGYVDPSNGVNNCPIGYSPGPSWKPPPTPPKPSLAAQNAACKGQGGSSDLPLVYVDGGWVVLCESGNDVTIAR